MSIQSLINARGHDESISTTCAEPFLSPSATVMNSPLLRKQPEYEAETEEQGKSKAIQE